MDINLRNIVDEEECESYKEVVSRVGVQVVCDEEDSEQLAKEDAFVLPDTPECDSVVEIASKDGVKIICSDEE